MSDVEVQTIEIFDFVDAESQTEENKTKQNRFDWSFVECLQASFSVFPLQLDDFNFQSLFQPETDTPPP